MERATEASTAPADRPEPPDGSERPEPAAASPLLRMGYVPALDGMRAFAIVTVLLFHYPFRGHSILPGGFLGVDVFFVLSGFLITTLLMQEEARRGRISLGAFYVRRARRLLPLVAAVLAFGLVVNLVVATTTLGHPSRGGLLSVALYYSNWFRVFDVNGLGFLAPTWSLAIEEQFYLVWPLVILVVRRFGGSTRTLFAIAFVGAGASALWRYVLIQRAFDAPRGFIDFYGRLTGRAIVPKHAAAWDAPYYRTDSRADLLMLGCATAIALLVIAPRLTARATQALSVLGVASAGVVVLWFTQPWPYLTFWVDKWGRAVFGVAVAFVVAGVVVRRASWYARLLGVAPLVWIGRRAYSLYLVHVAVFTFLGQGRTHLGDWTSLAFEMAVVFAIASFTYRFVERPFFAPSTRERR